MLNLPPKFWNRVNKSTQNGCWEWIGALHNNKGPRSYGAYYHDGSTVLAHRLVAELTYGPIPKGMVVMHSCDNCLCVNPDHLSIGTYRQNNLDVYARGRRPKIHCANLIRTP